ncbi:LytTr DNA-binding domain-containing protein [Reichenbachiella faecimaris]|uniref:LytTr DNA-binding domain-containing protein n=1 Tax=Reichenbachiella faecimaris TaxID=692418 RepID=A0A1W2G717_REIFA|nr:LytTR family DNA-binding domain-containing protein [Reichenbachiella faecimaris]SMD32413.1 LytTr DNA-binding domain-containing protein [Reichenbachiella faecimaris]
MSLLETHKRHWIIKVVIASALLLVIYYIRLPEIGAVFGVIFLSRKWITQFFGSKLGQSWYPLKFMILAFLVVLCSACVYFLIALLNPSGTDDLISYLHLGKLIVFSIVGVTLLAALEWRSGMVENRAFSRQIIVIGFLIVFLFYFGNPDRFVQASFPLDDLMDLMYLISTMLLNWTIYQLVSPRVKGFMKKFDHVIFVIGHVIVLMLVFLPLDYFLLNWYLKNHYQTVIYSDYWVLEMPIKAILVILVGYFASRRQDAERESETLKFHVKAGKATKLLSVDEILFFQVQYQNTYAITISQEKMVMDESLSNLETKLDPFGFFRLNRQVLVKKEAIQSFEPLANRKLRIRLVPVQDFSPFHEISRLKAPDFKRWVAN